MPIIMKPYDNHFIRLELKIRENVNCTRNNDEKLDGIFMTMKAELGLSNVAVRYVAARKHAFCFIVAVDSHRFSWPQGRGKQGALSRTCVNRKNDVNAYQNC
jgi:hypothetical protein